MIIVFCASLNEWIRALDHKISIFKINVYLVGIELRKLLQSNANIRQILLFMSSEFSMVFYFILENIYRESAGARK